MANKQTFRFQVSKSFAFNFEAPDYATALERTAEFGVTNKTPFEVIANEPACTAANDWQEHLETAEAEISA